MPLFFKVAYKILTEICMDIDITDLNSTIHDGMKYSVWPTVGSKKYKMQLKVHFSRQISVQFRRLGLIRRMTVQG